MPSIALPGARDPAEILADSSQINGSLRLGCFKPASKKSKSKLLFLYSLELRPLYGISESSNDWVNVFMNALSWMDIGKWSITLAYQVLWLVWNHRLLSYGWSVMYRRTGDTTLQWRHNERNGVSNHRRLDCLFNRLFRRRSKKTSKLRVTGRCEGNSPVTSEFRAQRASNAENVYIWWRHCNTCTA